MLLLLNNRIVFGDPSLLGGKMVSDALIENVSFEIDTEAQIDFKYSVQKEVNKRGKPIYKLNDRHIRQLRDSGRNMHSLCVEIVAVPPCGVRVLLLLCREKEVDGV